MAAYCKPWCITTDILKAIALAINLQIQAMLYTIMQVMNSHSMPDGLLGDYCDGRLFKSSELYQSDPCALQIILYYDEVECCSDIGSKTHKLGEVFTITDNHTK